MNKKSRIVYLVVKVLFSLMIALGASQYFFNHEMVKGMFESLNFPTYLIYPMGVAKILGLIAIWTNVPRFLKEWAFGGFVFNLLLAISAHLNVSDDQFGGALVALILVLTTYVLDRKQMNQ